MIGVKTFFSASSIATFFQDFILEEMFEIKKRENKAEKAVKNILKQQQEGFSYGSKSFQQELEKKRKKEAEEKETQRQQNADSARRAFITKGIPFSDSKGKGHIVNGVKHYDT